ncbi:hypothetical protein QQM39_15890 [Streptomyces sp. DT2A-34]|nr:hypothetical protein [Streptomyces sp. DT2A-34]MDO0912273.1 hypothetical protein [Streptomyces sp. DT2A-34]
MRGIFESMVDPTASRWRRSRVPHSGHWPMYANPVAMRERIAAFQTRGDT